MHAIYAGLNKPLVLHSILSCVLKCFEAYHITSLSLFQNATYKNTLLFNLKDQRRNEQKTGHIIILRNKLSQGMDEDFHTVRPETRLKSRPISPKVAPKVVIAVLN